jgi:hypothetical protein
MDADVVLTLGSCIKRKQIFSELTELNKILLLNRKKLCQIQLSFKLNLTELCNICMKILHFRPIVTKIVKILF